MPEVVIAGSTESFDTLQIGEGLTSEVTGNTVTIGLNRGFIENLVFGSAIYSINGQYAAPDGSFYIHGSDCDSWGYVENDKALLSSGDLEDIPQELRDSGNAKGIWLTDLCPACQTCETIYQIKKDFEHLKIILGMLKDVELHRSDVVALNQTDLEALQIDGGENCAYEWENIVTRAGLELLQQYTTVVHMWNYAVVQNNASFKIEIAPEDTAGFVVQTKRSLPNCDGLWWVRCTITISYEMAVDDSGVPMETKQALSVFIPDPILNFKPFNMEEEVAVEGSSVITATAEDAALNGSEPKVYPYLVEDQGTNTGVNKPTWNGQTVEEGFIYGNGNTCQPTHTNFGKVISRMWKDTYWRHKLAVIKDENDQIIKPPYTTNPLVNGELPSSAFTTKIIKTTPINARVAGTYELTVKVLPFLNFVMENAEGVPISVRGGTLSYNGTTVSGGTAVYYDFAPASYNTNRLIVPSKDQYLNAKTAPTASVPFNNVWQVQIVWEVARDPNFTSDNHFTYQETRQYTCTGVRKPNSSAIPGSSLIPVDIPVDPTPPN